MKNKAQGMPVNVIIIAIIVLIVLVVLIAIFAGRMGGWGLGVDDATKRSSCTAKGGRCVTECSANEIRDYLNTCTSTSEICCVTN